MKLEQVGYFSKTHGIKGGLVLKCSRDFEISETKTLFVEINGAMAPYFVEEVKESGANIIINLEGFEKIEEARSLVGKKVFVNDFLIVENQDDNEFTGYEVIDKKYGSLGIVGSVEDNGAQILLVVNFRGKELMLPMAEELIENIDKEAKKVQYKAPEGLLEMYLDGAQ